MRQPTQRRRTRPITHCGDEPQYGTIATIDRPDVRVIVNPGGTNERFDRAHLQKATIVPLSYNATIFDALLEGKADQMTTDAVETRVQAKLFPERIVLLRVEVGDNFSVRIEGSELHGLLVGRETLHVDFPGDLCFIELVDQGFAREQMGGLGRLHFLFGGQQTSGRRRSDHRPVS